MIDKKTKQKIIKVTKLCKGKGYSWAIPSHGMMDSSNLNWIYAFMERHNFKFCIVDELTNKRLKIK